MYMYILNIKKHKSYRIIIRHFYNLKHQDSLMFDTLKKQFYLTGQSVEVTHFNFNFSHLCM